MNYYQQMHAGHELYLVEFLSDGQTLEKAKLQTAAKAAYTNANSPAAQQRTPEEIYNAQLLGTLADLACSELLQKYFDRFLAGSLSVVRYDDVRQDDYREPDQYDARIISTEYGTVLAEVEFRSSVCNRIPVAPMIRTWHVLGWYTTANKPAEAVRDFYMRPIFHYRNFKSGPEYRLANAMGHLEAGELDLYIVGGADAQLLRDHGRLQRGFGLLQDGATYQLIDITAAYAATPFLQSALNFCREKLATQTS